jgi:hypothetical protein
MTRRRGLALLSGLGVWGGRKYVASLAPAPDGVTWILWAKLDVQTEKADGRMVFERWEWEPSEGFLSKQECMEELRTRMPEDFKVQPIYLPEGPKTEGGPMISQALLVSMMLLARSGHPR